MKKIFHNPKFFILFIFLFFLILIPQSKIYAWSDPGVKEWQTSWNDLYNICSIATECNYCKCHEVKIVSATPPTCTSNGIIKIECQCTKVGTGRCVNPLAVDRQGIGKCGQYSINTCPTSGHSYGSGGSSIVIEPTCTSNGTKKYICYCGASTNSTIGKLGHKNTNCNYPNEHIPKPGYHWAKECDRVARGTYCGYHSQETQNTYYISYQNRTSDTNDGAIGGPISMDYKYDDGSKGIHNGNGFKKTWKVHFNGRNYGTATTGSTPSINLTRESYGYVATWKIDSLNKTFSPNDSVLNLTTTHNDTLIAYANYGTMSSVIFPTENDGILKVGYTLIGWTDDANAPTIEYPNDNGETNSSWVSSGKSKIKWKPGETRIPENNGKTYYAIWMPNEYTIVYNKNVSKYDSNHNTIISGKTYKEFYNTNTDNTKVTGTMANTKVVFDGSYTLRNNTYTKTSKGFYGSTIKYTFTGWSLNPNFSNYNSNSRIISTNNVRTSSIYFGYMPKNNLLLLSGFNYADANTFKNQNLYFYNNETIKNYRNNNAKVQYNLTANKNGVVNLYANWIAENQRPYTYFRLATKQYYQDGRWTGKLENIMYDNYPNSIATTSNTTTIYDDMPIYLNTAYFDPEGRVDDGQYVIEYQYSIDGGKTWYQLTSGLKTPNFYTTRSTINKTNLDNSKSLDNSYVIDNSKEKQFIYDSDSNVTTSNTIGMLEIHFYSSSYDKNKTSDSSLTTLIRSRARDTVENEYLTYISSATRKETTNQTDLQTKTLSTLKKPLWSTGKYAYTYSSNNINGTYINEYTGQKNSWANQPAFVENNNGGKNTTDNTNDNGGAWYTKTITCYSGNSTANEDKIIIGLDNKYSFPMYDYTKDNGNYNNQNGNIYLLISKVEENDIITTENLLLDNILENRGYVVKNSNNEIIVDYRILYKDQITLIRESKVNTSKEDNIHNKFSIYPNADESIGFINLSGDGDNFKHYTVSSNPTYTIDNKYSKKYYKTGNSKDIITYNNQFSNYFVAIYDKNGNEVLTQGGASSTPTTYDTNGVPKNASLYTINTNGKTINGHIYNSYDEMLKDIYDKTNALFSETSDLLNGEYTIYFGVCDKSWNIYSPNKWAIQSSKLIVSPRLSFYDIGITDFKQPNYKNEDKPQTLWLRTDTNNEIIKIDSGNITYTFPMYKLKGLTTSQTINGYKIYVNNFDLTQNTQKFALNSDYISDNSLAYTTNPLYNIQAGYNFTINTNIHGADYSELAIYDVNNPTTPIQVIQKDFDKITNKNGTNILMCYTCREHGTSVYEIALPEQLKSGTSYFATLKVYKTTLTNATHPISATNKGTNTLIRTFNLGSTTNPLFTVDDTVLDDIGIDVLN